MIGHQGDVDARRLGDPAQRGVLQAPLGEMSAGRRQDKIARAQNIVLVNRTFNPRRTFGTRRLRFYRLYRLGLRLDPGCHSILLPIY